MYARLGQRTMVRLVPVLAIWLGTLSLQACSRNSATTPSNPSKPIPAKTPKPELKMNSLFAGKPMIDLHLDAANMPYQIWVNGHRLFMHADGLPVELYRTINEYVHTGENVIELTVYPRPEPGIPQDAWEFSGQGRVSVQIGVRQHGDDHETLKAFTDIHFKGVPDKSDRAWATSMAIGNFDSTSDFTANEDGDVQVSTIERIDSDDGSIELRRVFRIPTPFRDWAFFGSEPVSNDIRYEEVFAQYKKIWTHLSRREYDTIVKLADERNREHDLAYFKRPGETADRLRLALESAMGEPGRKVNPIDNLEEGWYWQFRIAPNRRVLWLARTQDDQALINVTFDEENKLIYTFPFVFRMQDGEYIVTR